VKVAAGHAVIECGASEFVGPIEVAEEAFSVPNLHGALADALTALACNRAIHGRLKGLSPWFAREGLGPAGQAELLRDVVRAPFRLMHFPHAWRTANDAAVRHVAQEIERDEAFELFPLLADALMDAGCDCEEVIGHLQGPGPHVRGCWVLDAVLGKW